MKPSTMELQATDGRGAQGGMYQGFCSVIGTGSREETKAHWCEQTRFPEGGTETDTLQRKGRAHTQNHYVGRPQATHSGHRLPYQGC